MCELSQESTLLVYRVLTRLLYIIEYHLVYLLILSTCRLLHTVPHTNLICMSFITRVQKLLHRAPCSYISQIQPTSSVSLNITYQLPALHRCNSGSHFHNITCCISIIKSISQVNLSKTRTFSPNASFFCKN